MWLVLDVFVGYGLGKWKDFTEGPLWRNRTPIFICVPTAWKRIAGISSYFIKIWNRRFMI